MRRAKAGRSHCLDLGREIMVREMVDYVARAVMVKMSSSGENLGVLEKCRQEMQARNTSVREGRKLRTCIKPAR